MPRLLRRPRFYVLTLVGLIAVALIWIGITANQAKAAIAAARTDLAVLAQLEQVDGVALADALQSARTHTQSAYDSVHDPVWWLVSSIPVLGNTTAAAVAATEVGVELLAATDHLEQQLRSLPPEDASLTSPALLVLLGEEAAKLEPVVAKSLARLSEIDLTAVPDAVAGPVVEVRGQLTTAEPYLQQAGSFAKVAPILLGLNKPVRWLVVFASGAEARPSGGFPGGWGIVTADQGKLSLSNLETNDRLAGYRLANWQELAGEYAAELYGRDLSRVLDAGLSPDFELTAKLFWNLYVANTPGPKPIGVLQLDEHALANLLEITGPVDQSGVEVNAANAVEYITRDVYARYTDVQEKDQALLQLSSDVFAKLSTGEIGLLSLAKGLLPSMTYGRVRAWSHFDIQQELLKQTDLGGGLHIPGKYTHIVAVANGGGNKLEAYIQYNVQYYGGQCNLRAPYRDSTLRITVNNSAPRSGLPAYVTPRTDLGIAKPKPEGGTREIIYVHVPLGSELSAATVDGVNIDLISEGIDNGRTVWRFDLESPALSEQLLLITFAEPALERKPYANLWPQPMTLPMSVSAIAGPRCTL